jgi:hypothetical protein
MTKKRMSYMDFLTAVGPTRDEEPKTTWAGGGNGPVLPEDKPKKGDDAKCPQEHS